jgi:hypothetical protein
MLPFACWKELQEHQEFEQIMAADMVSGRIVMEYDKFLGNF